MRGLLACIAFCLLISLKTFASCCSAPCLVHGFYAGVQGVHQVLTLYSQMEPTSNFTIEYGDMGFNPALLFGYGRCFHNRLYLGLEGNYVGGQITSTRKLVTPGVLELVEFKKESNWSVRSRAGIFLCERTLFFCLIGGECIQLKISDHRLVSGSVDEGVEKSFHRWTPSGGIGVEHYFSPCLGLRLDFTYIVPLDTITFEGFFNIFTITRTKLSSTALSLSYIF